MDSLFLCLFLLGVFLSGKIDYGVPPWILCLLFVVYELGRCKRAVTNFRPSQFLFGCAQFSKNTRRHLDL